MRIQCLTTRSFLTRYLDERLGKRFARAIQNHVEGCEECRIRLDRLAVARRSLREFGPPGVTEEEWEELWSGVVQRIEEENEALPFRESTPFRRRYGGARYALIAAAVTVLVAGAMLRLLASDTQPQQTSISSFIQYHEEAADGHVLLENHFLSAQILPVSYAANQ